MIYYINTYTTLISAVLGVCFSIGAVIAERETSRTNALYMFARSFALACVAIIPVCRNAPAILFVVTGIMLIVQLVDCIIGIIIKSKMRTVETVYYGRLPRGMFVIICIISDVCYYPYNFQKGRWIIKATVYPSSGIPSSGLFYFLFGVSGIIATGQIPTIELTTSDHQAYP